MNIQLIAIALGALSVIGGCSISVPVTMYPVQGPYAAQQQKPIIHAIAHDVQQNSGAFEVTLPTGEKCQGRWSSAAGVVVTQGFGTSIGQNSNSLFTQYGSVVGYGNSVTSGFGASVSNVGGVNKGQAMSFCPSGRTLEAEFVTGSGTANGYGIAKDSEGNVYKMLF